MDLNTPNLNLPYIAPGQAQKHVTHNEAIRALDALIQLTVTDITNTPPASPLQGHRVIVGSTPSDEFIDHSVHIAAWQDGAWAFYEPQSGWQAFNQSDSQNYYFDGANWIGDFVNLNPVDLIGVNATADSFNRFSVKSPATLFDHEGQGHQLKINKALSENNSSLLFQSGYAGFAEIGLTGDNDLHIKVSHNGSDFKEACIFNAEQGSASFPNGIAPHQLAPTVPDCGGPNNVYGPPNLSTVFYGQGTFTLVKNRMYFMAVFVDRPTEINGGFVSIPNASSVSGAVIRCGLYHLGSQDDGAWLPGDLVSDFGTLPSDIAGTAELDIEPKVTVSPGWYAFVLGTNEAGVSVNFMRALTPGLMQVQPYGSGTSTQIRSAGAALYLFANNAGAAITNGLPNQWNVHPVNYAKSISSYQYMAFIPRIKRWAGAS